MSQKSTPTETLAKQPPAAAIIDELGSPALGRPLRGWWILFSISFCGLLLGVSAVGYLLVIGLGAWGINNGVAWAYAITNFVFWIGVGHAGTLISAVLLLLRQDWRIGVHRAAETMTIIAILCAAVFPVIHLGRPWLFGWLLPLPNDRGPLWINFASALTWDVFAILTYFVTSVLFWYLGLVPDLAIMRAAATGARRRFFGWLSLGWTGSPQNWIHYRTVNRLLAGLATALVVSVHSVVSFDFATAIVPGWHSTIFPPFFVIGAIFSGIALVLALCIGLRRFLAVQDYVTVEHIDALSKLMLATSCLLGLSYLVESLMPFYAGHTAERFVASSRIAGETAALYWTTVVCNVLAPQLLWSKAVRRNLVLVLVVSIGALFGMWLERFVIVVTSQESAFLPSAWTDYAPTGIEIATLIGSFGLFFTLFLLFCRFLPIVSISDTLATRLSAAYPEADRA